MERPENEGGAGSIKGVVGGAIKKQLEGIVSTTSMIKRIMFGSAFRFLLFVTWFATLLGTVIVHANYDAWRLQNELLTAILYLSLDSLRTFFFLLSLFWQLTVKRLHKGIIFLLASMLAVILGIVPLLLMKYASEASSYIFSTVLILLFTVIDTAAIMAEKWRTIESTAPMASMVTSKLQLNTRHYHPMRWITIEMTLYLAIKELLHFFLFPDEIRLNASFLYWYFGDYALNLLIVISYFILRTRNDPYHHHLKSIIMCAVPLMQGWGILQAFTAYFSEGTGGSSLPFLAELLILAAMSVWQVGSNAAQKEEKERDSDKLYAFVLWTYAITTISAFYDAWGFNDIIESFAFMALGVGVIFFVKTSGDTLASKYSIKNFNFGTFGANKLVYENGEPVAIKRPSKVRSKAGSVQPAYQLPVRPAYQAPAISEKNFCNQCGKPIPAEDRSFCRYCGARIKIAFCTGCGNPVDRPGALFCRICGKKF